MSIKFTREIVQKLFKLSDEDTFEFETAPNKDIITLLTINQKPIDLILSNHSDEKIVLFMLPQEHFKELLSVTPKFKEYYNDLADNAFENEFDYKKGNVQKTIDDIESLKKNNSTNIIYIYFDIESGDLVTSIFADCYTSQIGYPVIYLWCLFTNPKYYRQGFGESIIKMITESNLRMMSHMKQDTPIIPIFSALAYVWNTPSINLFTKLGYVCTHTVDPENPPEDPSKLKKYTYNGTEYTEDIQLGFMLNPMKEFENRVKNLKVDLDEEPEFEKIEKVEH